MNICSPWRGLLPIPDGTLSHGDRQHVLQLCSAILAAAAATPTVFGDLTTLFAEYLITLRAAAPLDDDVTTLVANDLPTARAAGNIDDANTMYAGYLS